MTNLIDKSLLRKTRDNLRASADYQQKLASNIDHYLTTFEQAEGHLSPQGRASIAKKIAATWLECPVHCGTKHRRNHPHMSRKHKPTPILPDESVVAA